MSAHGEVVRVRLAYYDVLAAIDIVDRLDLFVPGMSLSQCVSLAIKATFESCRHSGVVPVREGTEYTEMVSRFPRGFQESARAKGRQMDIAKSLERGLGENNRVPPLQSVGEFKEPDPETHPNPEVRRLYHELKELDARRVVDPLNFDQQLYDRLNSELCKLI